MINYVASWFSALCSSGLHLHYCCNILHSFYTNLYFAIGMGAKYCDEYVCLSTHITQKLHGRSSPNFLCVLPALRYSAYFTFVDDIKFSYHRANGPESSVTLSATACSVTSLSYVFIFSTPRPAAAFQCQLFHHPCRSPWLQPQLCTERSLLSMIALLLL